jgi:hypothetical protein
MVAPGNPPCRTARAIAGGPYKTHKRTHSQLAEAAQSRSSRAKPTKVCRRKQPSPVVIEDEESHSEEAASTANEAQLPSDDITEDEDSLNDEDVEEQHDEEHYDEEHHVEDVELPTQLQSTSPLTQTAPEPPSSPEAPQTWQCFWKAVINKKVDMPRTKFNIYGRDGSNELTPAMLLEWRLASQAAYTGTLEITYRWLEVSIMLSKAWLKDARSMDLDDGDALPML